MDKAGFFASYDQHPYESVASPCSHPASMAAIGTLLGMAPPPLSGCRILELGCGTGPNLLPMAADLPDAELWGIDLSLPQIERCQATAAALSLDNVQFLARDLLQLGEGGESELGRFDYIIAHGVYSWVPAAVRDRVLAICRQHLSDNGLAYVSYNTYPGWNITNVLRDMLLYRVRGVADLAERARLADEALDVLSHGSLPGASEPPRGGVSAQFIHSEAARQRQVLDGLGPNRGSSVHHDLLGEVNYPVYFHQFLAHAEQHGLRFVAEATFRLPLPPAHLRERLAGMAQTNEELEQYLDFLYMTNFRQSLLCHAHKPVARSLEPALTQHLCVRAGLRPLRDSAELQPEVEEHFAGPGGLLLRVRHPVGKAALRILSAIAPAMLSFRDLLAAAQQQVLQAGVATTAGDGDELAKLLLRTCAYRPDVIQMRTRAPHMTTTISATPVAREIVRFQAAHGPFVTNAYHEAVRLTSFQRALLPLLDGTRDHAALVQALSQQIEEGRLTRPEPANDPEGLMRAVQQALVHAAGAALLLA